MPVHAPGVAWASQLGTMQGHMSSTSHSWLLLLFWLAGILGYAVSDVQAASGDEQTEHMNSIVQVCTAQLHA